MRITRDSWNEMARVALNIVGTGTVSTLVSLILEFKCLRNSNIHISEERELDTLFKVVFALFKN